MFELFISILLIILPFYVVLWVLFVIPMVYGDKITRGLFKDINPSLVDYME